MSSNYKDPATDELTDNQLFVEKDFSSQANVTRHWKRVMVARISWQETSDGKQTPKGTIWHVWEYDRFIQDGSGRDETLEEQ